MIWGWWSEKLDTGTVRWALEIKAACKLLRRASLYLKPSLPWLITTTIKLPQTNSSHTGQCTNTRYPQCKAVPSVSPHVPGCSNKSNNFPLSLLQSCQHVTPAWSHVFRGQREPPTLAALFHPGGRAVLIPCFDDLHLVNNHWCVCLWAVDRLFAEMPFCPELGTWDIQVNISWRVKLDQSLDHWHLYHHT